MEKINESYNFLTLMAVTPGKSFCIHGGLSRNINTLEELRNITKPYYKLDKILHNTYFQIQWNDPLEKIKGFSSSGRGDNIYQFGEDVVKQFLQKNQLKRIIRSHENSRGSYQKVFPNLIHIYSTGPYTDKKGSRKALIVHERKELINIIDLDLKIINK